jgi:hypothetical protein
VGGEEVVLSEPESSLIGIPVVKELYAFGFHFPGFCPSGRFAERRTE